MDNMVFDGAENARAAATAFLAWRPALSLCRALAEHLSCDRLESGAADRPAVRHSMAGSQRCTSSTSSRSTRRLQHGLAPLTPGENPRPTCGMPAFYQAKATCSARVWRSSRFAPAAPAMAAISSAWDISAVSDLGEAGFCQYGSRARSA